MRFVGQKNPSEEKYKGTFWKKFPLTPQKVLLFLQRSCKNIKILRGFGRSFTKDLPKLKNSIEDRPDISSRAEFGHWEDDTVELIRGRSYIVTMVERNTRFLMIVLVPNKKAETVRNAILSMFRHFPQAVKSITLDNGTEFADHKTIASRLNAPVYFAHPHSPWERGTNENTNRLLRQ